MKTETYLFRKKKSFFKLGFDWIIICLNNFKINHNLKFINKKN